MNKDDSRVCNGTGIVAKGRGKIECPVCHRIVYKYGRIVAHATVEYYNSRQ